MKKSTTDLDPVGAEQLFANSVLVSGVLHTFDAAGELLLANYRKTNNDAHNRLLQCMFGQILVCID